MKGEKVMRVLDAIVNGIADIATLTAALATHETSYGKSLPKALRYVEKLADERERAAQKAAERQRMRVIIAKLANERIIRKNADIGWRITIPGRNKLRMLKKRLADKTRYITPDEGTVKIVMFDVPERYRKYRNWIRGTLQTMNYEMLQKSVFAGTAKIPKLFIEDLDRRALLHYVQIFSVGKSGTLENHINAFRAKKYLPKTFPEKPDKSPP